MLGSIFGRPSADQLCSPSDHQDVHVNSRLVASSIAAVSMLGVAGCGSDSTSSSSSRATTVAALAKSAKSAKDDGIQVDEDCAAKVVDKFSDADYTLLSQSVADDNLDATKLSSEGQGLVVELFDCSGGTDGGSVPVAGGLTTTQTAILAQLKTSLSSSGLTVDDACLEKLVSGLDVAAIATQDAEVLAALGAQAAACVEQP